MPKANQTAGKQQMDALKERIRYYTEWIRLFWVGMFVVGGGALSLLLTLDSLLKTFLFVLGMVLQVVFVLAIGIIHGKVIELIGRLEKSQ